MFTKFNKYLNFCVLSIKQSTFTARTDAVFFYNKDIEVDFYIPDESLAIQVSYSLDNDDGTLDREINAPFKLTNVLNDQRTKCFA